MATPAPARSEAGCGSVVGMFYQFTVVQRNGGRLLVPSLSVPEYSVLAPTSL